MKIKLTYRKGARPIYLSSNETTIESLASDFAKQLARKYENWKSEYGGISPKALKRYEIGQRYMLIQKLEEKLK